MKKEFEQIFIREFKKYLLNEEYDKDELRYITAVVKQDDLQKWVTIITKKRVDEETKKKENESGWFGFFKQKKVQEESKEEVESAISSEEIEEVYKTLYEKFIKNDSSEEEKDPSDIKTLQVELLVKKGGLSLQNKENKINLFFNDCGF